MPDPSATQRAALSELLTELFTPEEIQPLLRSHHRARPDAQGLRDLDADALAARLFELGLVDGPLFAAMERARPARAADLEVVRQRCGARPAPSRPQSVTLKRPGRVVYGDGIDDTADAGGRLRALGRRAWLLVDRGGADVKRFRVPYGAALLARAGSVQPAGARIVQWDPNVIEVLSDGEGALRYADLIPGRSLHRWASAAVVLGEEGAAEPLRPRLERVDAAGSVLRRWFLPPGAELLLDDGAPIGPGELVARIARTLSRTRTRP